MTRILRWLTLRSIARKALIVSCVLAASTTTARALVNVSDPGNVLPGAGRTVTVSSVVSVPALADKNAVIDNFAASNTEDASFLFGQSDSPNLISISGFSGSGIKVIRIFTANDPTRQPTSISVRSSTSPMTTLTSGDYETDLGTFPFTLPITLTPYDGATRGYFDLTLATPSPVGTQSLFMSLTAPTSGIRLYEVQALVPEPASAGLLAAAAALTLMQRRNRRR